MLNKIIINNVNSISKCEINFKKDKYQFLLENTYDDIVNPVAIYGHNGSGKTSIIKAIQQLVSLMNEPAINLKPFIVNNFLFDKYHLENKKQEELITGSIELLFDINDIEYDYYISTSSYSGIVKEYLKAGRKTIFERTLNEYTYNNKKKNIEDITKLISTLRSLASKEINDDVIQRVYTYISSITIINPSNMSNGRFINSRIFNDVNFMDLLVNKSTEVKEILKNYKEFPIYTITKKEFENTANTTKYFLELEGENFSGLLPFEFISEGMRNQSIVLSLLLSMPENGIIFIDEVEQALHPTAIKSFLDVVKEKHIQLFFSSHNTYILQLLRPDQIYFAHWDNGSSKYARLSSIYPNIREVNNIEKMYLSSLFDEAIKNEK